MPTVWARDQPAPFSRELMAERARSHADALLRKVEDPSSPLSEPGRKVLGYACELAKTRGIDRVALPRRTVMTQTGLGERSVRGLLSTILMPRVC